MEAELSRTGPGRVLLAEPSDHEWTATRLSRLSDSGDDRAVRDLVNEPIRPTDRVLIRTWSDRGCAIVARSLREATALTVVLAVGLARWVPFRWLMQILDREGLAPIEVRRGHVDGHMVVELDVVRDASAPAVVASALELAAVAASFERAGYRPLRAAVDDLQGFPLADLPQVTDLRQRWSSSQPALRIASPQVLVSTGAGADPEVRGVVASLVGEQGERTVETASFLTGAELWPQVHVAPLEDGIDGRRTRLHRLYHQPEAARPEDADGLAPEVSMAHAALAAATDAQTRAFQASRVRQSIRRHHSSVALERALMRNQATDRWRGLRIAVALDPGGTARARQRTLRSIDGQSRPATQVLEPSAALPGWIAERGWPRELQDADLLVRVRPGVALAPMALEQFELAGLLWRPAAIVVPPAQSGSDDIAASSPSGAAPGFGPLTDPASTPLVSAFDRRALEMVAGMEPAARTSGVTTDIHALGGIVLRTSPYYVSES